MKQDIVHEIVKLKVADEAWIALALMHREHPERQAFSAREIVERVKAEGATPEVRAGIPPHVSLHNVANLPANSARYRMFYQTADKKYRLWRPGDEVHPSRTGKTRPERHDLPERYAELIEWYELVYCSSGQKRRLLEDDPFLKMRGIDKETWKGIDPDEYVRNLRKNWYGPVEED